MNQMHMKYLKKPQTLALLSMLHYCMMKRQHCNQLYALMRNGLSRLTPFPLRRDQCAQIWVYFLSCTLGFALTTAAVPFVAPPPLLCLKPKLMEAEESLCYSYMKMCPHCFK